MQPNSGNFDDNGLRPGERCETKWRTFLKIHPNVWIEGPGTEQNFRFGSGWQLAGSSLCGHVLWDGGYSQNGAGRGLWGTFAHGCMLDVWLVVCCQEKLTLRELHFDPFA